MKQATLTYSINGRTHQITGRLCDIIDRLVACQEEVNDDRPTMTQIEVHVKGKGVPTVSVKKLYV